ncbi:MAG: WD40/YVTN/BNR-like repeat-containing protein, partial [Candidatus Geothermincolia bacterium]
WVGGGGNDIEVTTDGGASWNPVGPGPPTATINRVKAFDNNRVYAIGDSAGFFSTTDGGANWNLTPISDKITLFDMSFINTTTGWISGTNDFGAGFVAATTNGGANWAAQTPSMILSERNIPGISAAGGAIWASSEDGSTFRSADGGSTWDRFGNTWTTNTLVAVSAIDARSAWAAGDTGAILRTFNGGESWVTQRSSTAEFLSWIDAVGSSTAWAVGLNGTIVKTTDYGNHWIPQSSGTTQDMQCVAAVDAYQAWACAFDDNAATILHTTNGGDTWTHAKTFDGTLAYSVAALGEKKAWFGVV